MKKIVKGNDFTMRVIVNKIVDGEQQPFSLPACEEVKALAVGRYRRYELGARVDAKDDSVLLVRVEGDKLPLGKYALEVKGKLFGNDWRSNEYCQFALVDSNAEADTEFRRDLVEGEDSVEMDTAIVFLPPEAGLTELADKLKAETLKDVKAELDRQLPTDAYECAKKRGYEGTEEEYYATFTEVGHLKENIKGTLDEMTEAEKLRVAAETERAKAEAVRQSNRDRLNTAESERVKNEQQRTDNETKRQQAERERVQAENVRIENEKGRSVSEQSRADAETKRESAEQLRVEAETMRVETDKEVKSTLEYVNAQKYIKENEYEREVRAIEAIKNAPKDPTQDVWLDATDGEIKSGPAEGNLTKNAITYYYLGKRTIKGGFTGSTREGNWTGNSYVRHLDVRNWDMTLCTDANLKFYGYSSLISLDTSNWNLSALTNGQQMFSGCGSLQTLDTSNWNLSALTNGQQMFSSCGSLQTLDTSNWKLSALANASQMFRDCGSLQTLDTSNWNLSALTNGYYMFGACGSLQTLDTSNWNLSALTNGQQMFYGCNSLQTLDTSNWKLSALADASQMFRGCGSLQTLDTSNWNLSALTNGNQMFGICGSLQTLDTSNWKLSALTNGYYMFGACGSLQTLDFRKSTFRNVTNFGQTFSGCNSLAELWLPLTFDKLNSINLSIPSWGSTPEGLASLRWTFGDGADDRTAKGLQPCTVRLHANVYDRLTDKERAAAAKKGWTITK